jgi:hypothetical protein
MALTLSPRLPEEEPLFPQEEATTAQPEDVQGTSWQQAISAHLTEWKIIYLIGLFIFLDDLGGQIRVAPEVEMLERLVCRDYYQRLHSNAIYRDGVAVEYLCKADGVQSQLANLRGGLSLVRGIAQLMVVLPFGLLADKVGRRLVITLSLLSLCLADGWIVIVCEYNSNLDVESVLTSEVTFIMFCPSILSGYRQCSYFWVEALRSSTPPFLHQLLMLLFLNRGT